jgi:hypothetical protein
MPHSCSSPSTDYQQDKVSISLSQTLVVIDSRLDDVELLVGGVQPGAMVQVLRSNQDGVEQITTILQQHPDIAVIHLVSHGKPGAVQLGNTELSLETLDHYTDQFSLWSKLLASNAQLLLYGCEVAKGDRGKLFVHDLSNLTGATIAASTTKVGNAAQGGNWCLKATTAPMVVQYAFLSSTLEQYKATLGNEFRVNKVTKNEQRHSSVTRLTNGGFIVAWSSLGQDGDGYGIYGQRYDANGNAVGNEFLVNTTRTNDQDYSSVTGLTNGGFVLTWSSLGQDGDGYGIYGQRYDASGNAAGNEFLINATTTGNQISSSVASLTNGGFVVTWSSSRQDGDGWGIYGKRYDASGNAVGNEFLINATTTGDQISSSVASLTNGGFVVTWSSSGQDGDGWGIYGKRYDASGNAVGNEFLINTTTTGDQDYSSVTGLTNGGFVVTWSSEQDDSGWRIYGKRYDASGNAVGNEFLINTTTTPQSLASVTGLTNGGFIVSWSSLGQDGNGYGIYAQRYDASGTSIGDHLSIKQFTEGDQWDEIFGAKSVAVLSNGNLVVTWCSNALGDDSEVFARILDLSKTDLNGNDNTNESVVNPNPTTTGDNKMTVATLSVTDTSTLIGKVGIGGAPATGTEKLKVTGDAAIAGTLSVTGASNSLTVEGTSTLTNNVGIGGAPATGTEKLKVTGDAAISGTLSVTGTSNSLTVEGTSTLTNNVGIGGAPATGTEKLNVTGDTAIAGNLSVTGSLTIGSGDSAVDVRNALAAKANTTDLDDLKHQLAGLKAQLPKLSEDSESGGANVERTLPSKADATDQANLQNQNQLNSLPNDLDDLQKDLNSMNKQLMKNHLNSSLDDSKSRQKIDDLQTQLNNLKKQLTDLQSKANTMSPDNLRERLDDLQNNEINSFKQVLNETRYVLLG